jgi:hypothetical protein
MHARVGAAGIWGIVGVLALLGEAIYRLAPRAIELRDSDMTMLQWIVLVVWVAFNGYSEGYRGFHQNFSPRVIVRAQHLSAHPRPLFVALAPLYVMGHIHATRRRMIVAWSLTAGIIALVVAVRELAQPWRGIVDAGVVVGLALGSVSILYHWVGRRPEVPADVPS